MTPPLETPLHVLGRTNLDKYLIERAKLAAKTRGDVPENFRGRGAFIIGDENTFGEACAMMRRLRVQSMPLVRYKTLMNTEEYEALCFLSVGDLAATLVSKFDAAGATLDATENGDVISLMGRMSTIGLELESLPLKHARTKWDGTVIWKSATAYHSLADALQRCLYVTPESKPGDVSLRAAPHRFAVMNDENFIEYVVSQSDVCMYLHTNRDILSPAWRDASVEELGLTSSPKWRRWARARRRLSVFGRCSDIASVRYRSSMKRRKRLWVPFLNRTSRIFAAARPSRRWPCRLANFSVTRIDSPRGRRRWNDARVSLTRTRPRSPWR